ncbi:MAG: hypothetical protein U5P10_14730 [Spirochaetia bacterium]|nr:hypothetical protein [Spirochaetia bacterium]
MVVQLNSCFYSNLSDSEKSQLGLIPASYGLSDFRHNVMDALVNRFGSANVVQGNKSVKIQFNSTGVVPADVVVCIEYRHYSALRVLYTGMGFLTNAGQELIINYPKLHYENGTKKSDRTSGAYKKTVRMFKNANRYFRERYQARTVPSYLIECSLYNIKDSLFSFQLRDRFYKIASLLAEDDVSNFVSQNGIGTLWGNRPDQFEASLLRKFACNMQKL